MEPLIKSAMNRVAIENEMIARRTTQVVLDEYQFLASPWNIPTKVGYSHAKAKECKAAAAAMWDLIRGSITL